MIRDEGVIKFDCQWRQAPAPPTDLVARLIDYRTRLHRRGLIGVYPDGIGFGNISERHGNKQFIVSASQTGHVADVSAEHFVRVTDFDAARNWLECSGAMRASSESLTHAMIYCTFPQANAVIHVHHRQAWDELQDHLPTSRSTVAYGTPAMTDEVRRLASESALPDVRLLVMAGHEEGILSFGADLEDAFQTMLAHVGNFLIS